MLLLTFVITASDGDDKRILILSYLIFISKLLREFARRLVWRLPSGPLTVLLVHTLGICPVAESLSSREKFVHACCGGQKQVLECSRMFAIGAVERSR